MAGAIKLTSALKYLHAYGGAECSETVQSALLSRIDRVSNARIRALRHKVTCYLPRSTALLLERIPGLLSAIIDELDRPSLRYDRGCGVHKNVQCEPVGGYSR